MSISRRLGSVFRRTGPLVTPLLLCACGGGDSGGGTIEPEPQLDLDVSSLTLTQTLGARIEATGFQVRNTGGGTLSFSLESAMSRLTLSSRGGTAATQGSVNISARANCADPGSESGVILVSGNNQAIELPATVECVRPPLDLMFVTLPESSEGNPMRAAESVIEWRAKSSWDGQGPVSWSISSDRDGIVFDISTGSAAMDEVVGARLTATCPDQAQFDAPLALLIDEQELTTRWSVRCRAGNARHLAVELFQGPLVRSWNIEDDTSVDHLRLLLGRRTLLASRIAHDSPTLPRVNAALYDSEDALLTPSLPSPLEATTRSPGETGRERWESEYTFNLAGESTLSGHRVEFGIDADDDVDETNETDNETSITIAGWHPPRFRITFVPVHSDYGEPSEIDPEAYMRNIYALLPIGAYEARLDNRPIEFVGEEWNVVAAHSQVIRRWNRDGGPNTEFYHGIFRYPYDGSSCGRSWFGGPVSISASFDGGCTDNIHPHEVGHDMSLLHVAAGCGEPNTDPDYPYPLGGIGPNRGWLFTQDRFVNPDENYVDTMGYCRERPKFISDYHYNKALLDREAFTRGPTGEATGQQARQDQVPTNGPSLALSGAVDEAGIWTLLFVDRSVRPARMPPADTDYRLSVRSLDGAELHQQALAVYQGAHDDLVSWVARIPLPSAEHVVIMILDADDHTLLEREIETP